MSNPNSILFKDYLYLDDESEYLKRYYRFDEILPRMNILTDFYENSYNKVTRPNLLITECFKIYNKRTNKHNKLINARLN